MKKLVWLMLGLEIIAILALWTGCIKKEDPDLDDDKKEAYQQVLNLQDDISTKLGDWFASMDSLEAINKAQKEFTSDPGVSSATISNQGISVQYTNGMRGGIFLNPMDHNPNNSLAASTDEFPKENKSNLKSTVKKRKMILLNPHYSDRSYFTDQIYSIDRTNLDKVAIDLSAFYKNEEATVDRFTELSEYGIVQIYSHGYAWPKEKNITDVYLLTGEIANESTTTKYWDELKTGNIPIMKVFGSQNYYFISKDFVEKYNDFSQDTVLFIGGFCYSFLGNWPDITKSFGDGAYLGYDWSVNTYRNADWSVNLLALMSDTTKSELMNLESWMNDPSVEKSYFNSAENRTVHIYYSGDGTLKLWDKTKVSLISLSTGGIPVSNPGEAGVAYQFRCSAVTSISPLEYVWDIGDGSTPAITQGNEVNITWSDDGEYELSVTVLNKNNGAPIGSAKLSVTIGSITNEIIEFAQTCNYSVFFLRPGSAIIPDYGFTDASWIIDNIEFNGLAFSGSTTLNDMTHSISGTLSSDGQMVSFTALNEGKVLGYNIQEKIAITVKNYPLKSFTNKQELTYEIEPPGGTSYVTNVEGYINTGGNIRYITTSDFNWNALTEFYIFFNKQN